MSDKPTPQPDPDVVLTTDEVVTLVVATQGDGTSLADAVRRMIAARTADAAARLAAVEALADEARDRKRAWPRHPHWSAWDHHESDLRAALSATTPDAGQREASRVVTEPRRMCDPQETE